VVAGLLVPDVVGAVIALLQNDPDVVALCGQRVTPGQLPRIASAIPEVEATDARHWRMPDYAILIRRAGGRGSNLDIDLHFARVDIRCFGPGTSLNVRRRTADELWRTIHPVLCPPAASGLPASWHRKRTIIQRIMQEAEPIPMQEEGTDWAYVLCPYTVVYQGARLAA
jgi:hypothetical protein